MVDVTILSDGEPEWANMIINVISKYLLHVSVPAG